MSTYTRSRVGEHHADRLLEWCTSPEYRAEQVRYSKIRTFSKKAVNHYVPDGIQREDFTYVFAYVFAYVLRTYCVRIVRIVRIAYVFFAEIL